MREGEGFELNPIDGGVTAAQGFRAAGAACGIKKVDRKSVV